MSAVMQASNSMSTRNALRGSPEPVYEVVWPLGRLVSRPVAPAPALADLNGKIVCELWDWVFRGEQMYPILRGLLQEKYPRIRLPGDWQQMLRQSREL